MPIETSLTSDDSAVDILQEKKQKKFDWEEFIYKNKTTIILIFLGLILIGFGALLYKSNYFDNSSKIEVLESPSESQDEVKEIVVEVSGAVEKPGVYRFKQGDRIDDALIACGGLSVEANREWIERFVNRAAILNDGQKIYIPSTQETLGTSISDNTQDKQSEFTSANNSGGDQGGSLTQGSGLEKSINVNTATQSELESLWGIGPVTAQNIIEHRPYSRVEELLEKKILKSNVYERNKNILTVF